MEHYLKNLADNIFREMGRNNWTQQVTADFCSISRKELIRILQCRKDVQLSTLVRIADGLEMHVTELLI